MQVSTLTLSGVKIIHPDVFSDDRGFFIETFSALQYPHLGIDVTFVQDNHSHSVQGTLRGLHYQSFPGQAKLVWAMTGRIWDVVVDIRPQSPTFGRWEGTFLDAETHAQVFIPVGFAHGFCVVSDYADVMYKVSAPYDPATECSIRYDDPELAVKWSVGAPLLSERDRKAPSFAEYRARFSNLKP